MISKEIAQAIADSWKPLGSNDYKSQSARASSFGVSKSFVGHIDARTRWHEIIHPNQKLPIFEEKKQKIITRSNLNREYWKEILKKLQERRILATENNQYCGTPCWNRKQRNMTHKRRMKGISTTFSIFNFFPDVP